ncbi:hypothetical protein SAMN05660742_11013 [Propionispira arboris]|uniref:Uncharacterized protein n=2 Tax=Propionispira arboris TaxID=84035 RepID=A0A1H7A021_9FIRM|nr:hypothetical protein SAMN05660742_11013 [Propionispira arboris]
MKCSYNIEQALRLFKKEKGKKKAFLFHQGQMFYFYDHEFCELDYVNLSLSCRQILVEYQRHVSSIDSIFIRIDEEKILVVKDKERVAFNSKSSDNDSFKLALSYGICYDKAEKQYLRGIVYVNAKINSQIFSAYFTEADIAALFEQLIFYRKVTTPTGLCKNNFTIGDFAKKINRKSIKGLSKLYLQGKNVTTFEC